MRQIPFYLRLVPLFCLQISLLFIHSLVSLNSSPDTVRDKSLKEIQRRKLCFLLQVHSLPRETYLHNEDCRGPGFRRKVYTQWHRTVGLSPFLSESRENEIEAGGKGEGGAGMAGSLGGTCPAHLSVGGVAFSVVLDRGLRKPWPCGDLCNAFY